MPTFPTYNRFTDRNEKADTSPQRKGDITMSLEMNIVVTTLKGKVLSVWNNTAVVSTLIVS